MKVLVWVEARDGKVKQASLECLTALASSIAADDLIAVGIGSGSGEWGSQLKGYGCEHFGFTTTPPFRSIIRAAMPRC